MGHWHLALGFSGLLILAGLFTHWSLILAGALLPFVPLLSFLLQRRKARWNAKGKTESKN